MASRNIIYYKTWSFDQDKIKDANVYLSTSLLSAVLPSISLEYDTMSVVVECGDPRIVNFTKNEPLTWTCKGRVFGVFRVQDIRRVGPVQYKIFAIGVVGLLDGDQHMGGIYTGQTAGAVIADVCGTVPVLVKSNLQEIKLYGWLPAASRRENLGQVVFALGAVLKIDLDGALRVENLWDGVSGPVEGDRMYEDAGVDYAAKVTAVTVAEHQYIEGTESRQLFDGTTQAGDVITFLEPMHGLTATGFSILESGANYAKVSAGTGTLTGLTYIHNTRQITKPVAEAPEPNVKTVEKATLVSLVNAEAVASRLADFYRCTETIDTPIVYQGERPGDVLLAYHPYDETYVRACLQSVDVMVSNTLKAQAKMLVGFVPSKISGDKLIDTCEILTEDGTWTVPEGVKRVRAVLIGGGTGGPGGTGGNGCAYSEGYAKGGSGIGPIDSDGIGPDGGAGADGGIGGKILQLDLDVTPGDTFAVSIGRGGQGGTGGIGGKSSNNGESYAEGGAGNAGTDGNATAFGAYTSENGAADTNGFLEIISGIIYAAQGERGLPGGHGGGTYGGPKQGESLYDQTGGLPGTTESGSKYTAQGGGGGGSAVGAPGYAGCNAEFISSRFTIPGDTTSYTGYCVGVGGNGATPIKASTGLVYGQGGQGGHGGGGAGNIGGGTAKDTYCVWVSKYGSTSTANAYGGDGGVGGDGAQGCIILYYSLPKIVRSGPVVTKDGKWINDRLRRRFIV